MQEHKVNDDEAAAVLLFLRFGEWSGRHCARGQIRPQSLDGWTESQFRSPGGRQ